MPGIQGNKKSPYPLGKQLRRKVKSGQLSQGKAQQTAYERSVLAKAFGDDWRTKVYGKGGAKAASGPFAQRQVAADRSQALARAKAKLGGGVGSAKAPTPMLRVPNGNPLNLPKRGVGPLPLKKRKLR
jgi:hypothetical protein